MRLDRGAFDRTRSHWWWRPGWCHGTRYVTWHLTFERASALRAEAVRVGRLLSTVPMVDVVPAEWLHLTMTGVGFADDLESEVLDRIARRVIAGVASLRMEPLSLNRLYLHREGLSLAAEPSPWLTELKRIQERAISAELGRPEGAAEPFHPHVSLAYFRGEVDLEALTDALALAPPGALAVREPMVSLLELGRDEQVYTWRVLAQQQLLGSAET